MAKAKVKTAAAQVAVPQTKEEVTEAIAAIGRHTRERARIEAAMGDDIAAIKQQYEADAAPHAAAIVALTEGVTIWCSANREVLTQNGKTKTATFPSGDVAWRITPPKVMLKGVEAILAALKRRGLDHFIRTKEEVNKEAILNDFSAVRTIAGISLDQREEFVITPHEAALQDVGV